jgi:hypothetical protein
MFEYYCRKNHPDSTKKLSETDTINMLEVLTDNIFGGRIFEHSQNTYMYNHVLLLADLFLYSYEAGFIQGLLKKNRKDTSPIL